MENNNEKVQLHKDICDILTETYAKKNEDYGDSFAKTREEFPDAILMRIMDKFERLKQLNKSKTTRCEDESIVDTLMDMANYCIMELIERELIDRKEFDRKIEEEVEEVCVNGRWFDGN